MQIKEKTTSLERMAQTTYGINNIKKSDEIITRVLISSPFRENRKFAKSILERLKINN